MGLLPELSSASDSDTDSCILLLLRFFLSNLLGVRTACKILCWPKSHS